LQLQGLFSQRNTGFRLFFLLLLIFFFGSIMQIFGWILSSSAYDISIDDLIRENGVQAWNAGGRNILRLFQVLSVSGMFVMAPMAFAYFTYSNREEAIGFGKRIDFLLLIVVAVIILMASYPVDGLVKLNESLLYRLFDAEGQESFRIQQEAMTRQMVMMLESDHWLEDVFSFLMIACLPALAEELLFRGVLQKELLRGLGVFPGIILTAILFALTHWQPVNLLGLFFFGLILGLMRYWSNNLWYPIAGHFVNNAVVWISVKQSPLSLDQALNERPESDPFIYALTFAGLLFGLLLFWWLLQKRGHRPMRRYDS
jgi:membrane protease YdiL (CAAX protease family)